MPELSASDGRRSSARPTRSPAATGQTRKPRPPAIDHRKRLARVRAGADSENKVNLSESMRPTVSVACWAMVSGQSVGRWNRCAPPRATASFLNVVSAGDVKSFATSRRRHSRRRCPPATEPLRPCAGTTVVRQCRPGRRTRGASWVLFLSHRFLSALQSGNGGERRSARRKRRHQVATTAAQSRAGHLLSPHRSAARHLRCAPRRPNLHSNTRS
jgi:hypothetical protein